MNLTALIWLSTFSFLSLCGFSRPVYACSAYMLTFYAPPVFWWWGNGVLNSLPVRWNLVGAIIVIVTLLVNWHRRPQLKARDHWFLWLMGIYVVNAFFVNWLLANFPAESAKHFDLVWKSVGLALVMRLCISEVRDLHILMLTIVLLSAYIGYEVVINGAGHIIRGRLEGLRFPGATGSNGVAAVLAISFPLIGYFVVCNPLPYSRIVAFLSAPLILDTLLRCNSRGAYLGAGCAGICLLLTARGRSRRYAALIVAGGAIAFCLQAQNGQIWERLWSVTASKEERDGSAESRILSWIAGLEMIADYPLGSGGHAAFVSPRGMTYIQHIRTDQYRAIHNGYLNIMAGWGVQGFVLLMLAFAGSTAALIRAVWRSGSEGDEEQTFLGATILAALCGQAVITIFGDYLDGEWFIWLAVFGLSYAQLCEDSVFAEAYDDDEETGESEEEFEADDFDPDMEDATPLGVQFR